MKNFENFNFAADKGKSGDHTDPNENSVNQNADKTAKKESAEYEVDDLILKFFRLDAIRGDLWKKEEVKDWNAHDFVRAIMSYAARDLKSEAHRDYPMKAIMGEALDKKYSIEGYPQKYSLRGDILPLFPNREIRDEVEWFFNALNTVEIGTTSIEEARKDGNPESYFDYLRTKLPEPFRWSHFFRENLTINGKKEKFTSIDVDLGFGELAQVVARVLLRRVVGLDDRGGSTYNMFAHDAKRSQIMGELETELSKIIRLNSSKLSENNADSQETERIKKEKADIMAFLVVNYTVKFLATLVPWPISDINVSRYDSLIQTKLYRFGASELKYLEDGEQEGKLSVYDRSLIASFGRLLENPLTGFVLRADFFEKKKDQISGVESIEKGCEYITLLELLMNRSLVTDRDIKGDKKSIENEKVGDLDERQKRLLNKFGKVYIDDLPTLITKNIPANQNGFWAGLITHTDDMWKLIKDDSLPMDSLLREASSRGVFEDFKATVPSEKLKNNLANIYKRVDYWMGDYVVKDKDGNQIKKDSYGEIAELDPENRFMKLKRKDGWVLMNFSDLFTINPDWNSGQKGNSLMEKLGVTKEQVEFMNKDLDRLYLLHKGTIKNEKGDEVEGYKVDDQYTMLRKLITEKFVIASIRRYLSEQTNKNYLTYKEKMALAELLSDQFADDLLDGDLTPGNILRRATSERRSLFLGEAYPKVTTGIWTKNEALALLDVFPGEPMLYNLKNHLKKEKK